MIVALCSLPDTSGSAAIRPSERQAASVHNVVLHSEMVSDTPRHRAVLVSTLGQDEIDVFMERVLQQRRVNWDVVYSYVFSERERAEVVGSAGDILESYSGDFVGYLRESYLVRSPVQFNGVRVSEESRKSYEGRWLKRERDGDAETDNDRNSLEREYFLGFKFEPGNYFVAGRETFEDREVLRVEYYPRQMFGDDERVDTKIWQPGRRADPVDPATSDPEKPESVRVTETETDSQRTAKEESGREIEEKFNKTTLVTMLILPERHQIVKITFNNVGLDFLPLRWLMRVDDLEASMIMDDPLDNVWLPQSITAHGKLTMVNGSYTLDYRREFFDYRRADIKAKVRFRVPEQRDE